MTDGLPTLALEFHRRCRHDEALRAIGVLGLVPMFEYSHEVTRDVAFHVIAIGQLSLTYSSRHTWLRLLANPCLHAAVVGGVAIQFAAASVPAVSIMLGNAAIPVEFCAVLFVRGVCRVERCLK